MKSPRTSEKDVRFLTKQQKRCVGHKPLVSSNQAFEDSDTLDVRNAKRLDPKCESANFSCEKEQSFSCAFGLRRSKLFVRAEDSYVFTHCAATHKNRPCPHGTFRPSCFHL